MRARFFVQTCVLAGTTAIVAACGGGGGTSGTTPALPVQPQAQPSSISNGATFTIRVPQASTSTSTSNTRSPEYISANTQSASITLVSVNGTAVTQPPTIVNLTPSSPGCTTSGGFVVCTVGVPAPVGADVFSMTMYSATNAGGSALSSGNVSTTVTAGALSNVPIVLNGIVASISVTVGPPGFSSGYAGTAPVNVVVKDASGATIVAPGNYQPSITLTDSDTSGHTTLSATSLAALGASPVTVHYDGSRTLSSFIISATAAGVSSVTPATVAISPGHLYVGNQAALAGIAQYALPVTPGATPVAKFPGSAVTALAFDSAGNLATSSFFDSIVYYPAPVTPSSTPSATFVNGTGNGTQVAFNASGSLFASDNGRNVYGYTPPFSNSTRASSTTTMPITVPGQDSALYGIAFDAAANMIVTNYNVFPGPAGSTLNVFAPPYTGTPTVTTPVALNTIYRAMTVSGNKLFVPSVLPAGVDVYTLPPTASSTPAFSITNGVAFPECVVLDASGNLYVSNHGNSTITIYTPPLSAASTPAVTLNLGSNSPYGIAIGP